MADSDLLTIPEVASHLRVHPATVRRWIAEERLSAYRIGPRSQRVRRSELRRWVEAHRPIRSVTAESQPEPAPAAEERLEASA